MFFSSTPVEEGYIVISIDGTIKEEIPINSDYNEQRLHKFVFGAEDHEGFLEIVGSSVRMLPMDRDICPERICSDTGWINDRFQSIVCMPNRIHVYLEV